MAEKWEDVILSWADLEIDWLKELTQDMKELGQVTTVEQATGIYMKANVQDARRSMSASGRRKIDRFYAEALMRLTEEGAK